jgi:hypothetical protein
MEPIIRPRFGFPVKQDYRFRLRGRRYSVGAAGVRTLKLLACMYRACATNDDRNWPLRLRRQIRKVETLDATAVLCLVVERTRHPLLRILAIWLRGRCGGTLGTASIARFANDPDDATRKEVARALRRMQAWGPLQEMADGETDPRIQRLATAPASKPYAQRLANFTKRIACLPATTSGQPLFVSPELDLTQGWPPKSASFIRMILERIHRLLTGQQTRRS